MHLGTSEIILLLILILILFGSNRFPKIMENFAEGLKTFKKSLTDNKKVKKEPSKLTTTKKSKSSARKK